jgi:hypothetical protein
MILATRRSIHRAGGRVVVVRIVWFFARLLPHNVVELCFGVVLPSIEQSLEHDLYAVHVRRANGILWLGRWRLLWFGCGYSRKRVTTHDSIMTMGRDDRFEGLQPSSFAIVTVFFRRWIAAESKDALTDCAHFGRCRCGVDRPMVWES